MALAPVEDGSQRVVLYYTEPGETRTEEAASFKMGDLTGRWARFTLAVQGEEVKLYMDCEEHHRVAFRRSQDGLTFQPSSGIFIGNAGGTRLERFVVSLNLLVFDAYKRKECLGSVSNPSEPILCVLPTVHRRWSFKLIVVICLHSVYTRFLNILIIKSSFYLDFIFRFLFLYKK